MSRISIRAGRGLGDSLYLASIARHLVEQGHHLTVCSDYPDVFRGLARVDLVPFRRGAVDRVAHYVTRKTDGATSQFEDMCRHAGIHEPVDLRLDWTLWNEGLVAAVMAAAGALPIVLVQLPREPFGRTDGFGNELLPDCRVIQWAIDRLQGKAFVVQIGAGDAQFEFSGIDLDLANRTSVADLIDVASAAHGILGYCSFVVPLAESFFLPQMLAWSHRGLASRQQYIRTITPQKILHRPGLAHVVVDDRSRGDIDEAADAFCDAIRSRAAVRGQDSGDRGQRSRCAA